MSDENYETLVRGYLNLHGERPRELAEQLVSADRALDRKIDEARELRQQLTAAVERAERAEAERDALRRHYDAAGPEHNLLALLDLYFDERRKAQAERDEANRYGADAHAEIQRLRAELAAVRGAAAKVLVHIGCVGADEMGCTRDDGPLPRDEWCPCCELDAAMQTGGCK